jgi:riboflavin-specific deaminase-like protein
MSATAPVSVTVTCAQSLDGRIATLSGDSQWISGEATLRLSHRLRKSHDGILVGIGTVRRDDPELSCRLVRGGSPVRVILDAGLSISMESKIVRSVDRYETVIFCAPGADEARAERLRARGVRVAAVQEDGEGRLDIPEVLSTLASQGLQTLLVEGGSQVITSFLRAGRVDRMVLVSAPIIIGEGIATVGDLGVRELSEALRLRTTRVRRMGEDLVWELRING